MLASAIVSKIQAQFGGTAAANFTDFLVNIGIDTAVPLSAEKFLVTLMNAVSEAESGLPDAQKQNNFGYSIGEGGVYRATIKAIVAIQPNVIG
jgi:hypothetical protein